MVRLLRLARVCAAAWVFSSTQSLADDLADEADLEFRLGAERYTASDYRGALEHFLASNRLVRNRNAVFNIARTYEKLERYPEAFRYYTTALGAETDSDAKGRIARALELIRPHVAVLDVTSVPPGATLYVDRKDLGPRGESPRLLGLAPGRYRIIAELEGHYPAEATVDKAEPGDAVRVELVLRQILGTLRVEGAGRGARVRIDDPNEVPRCLIPCSLELSPGRHRAYVTLDGHKSLELDVDVVARAALVLKPVLEPITGSVLVSTDEPKALVEVDGRSQGFSPTVLALPVGEHRLRVSLAGFRPVEQRLVVLADRQVRVELVLTQAEEVEAASRVVQSVEDAPSSVTIIPREEIVAFGYPTIGDAVRGVPGVYVWNDRSYASLGVRGVGRLGSYSNRELVLLDGHSANDNWLGSAYVGFDGRTDLGDIERIEVVRGPGSVLYGTNAFSGVVNLITRRPGARPAGEVGLSAVDASVGRGRVRAETNLGKEGSIWTSIAGGRGMGRDFYFPELSRTTESGGHSRGADGTDLGTLQGRVSWRSLTAQWFLHSHDKELPTGEFETLLGDPRTHQRDTRSFVEVRAEPEVSDQVQLFSRLYLNHYRFRGDYARPPGPDTGGMEHDSFDGSWAGLEQRLVVNLGERLRLTLGGEGQLHYQVDAQVRDDNGYYLDETGASGRDYRVGAVYAMADAAPDRAVRLSAGVRLDAYSTFGSSLNPRAAVILRPYDRGNLKILGGKAFRAPSIYELYYNDGGSTQVSSPDLEPESIYSFEIEHSHRFTPTVIGLASVYANYVKDLVVDRGAGDDTDPLHYENSKSPLVSLGAELGVRREWRQGFMLQASYGYQHSAYLASTSLPDLLGMSGDPAFRHLENSPEHLGSFKAVAPILGRALSAATRVTVEGPRYDRYESAGDPEQGRTDAVALWDVVLSGKEARTGISYAVGAYNVTNYQYALPVSSEFTQARVLQDGRTFLISADVSF